MLFAIALSCSKLSLIYGTRKLKREQTKETLIRTGTVATLRVFLFFKKFNCHPYHFNLCGCVLTPFSGREILFNTEKKASGKTMFAYSILYDQDWTGSLRTASKPAQVNYELVTDRMILSRAASKLLLSLNKKIFPQKRFTHSNLKVKHKLPSNYVRLQPTWIGEFIDQETTEFMDLRERFYLAPVLFQCFYECTH